MRKSLQLLILGTALIALFATSSVAHAQATRTWVSGVGDDANPCSRTAPCKTFAGAISKTAPCGEIDVLDPGGFGALTITKCISIEAEGVIAGVLVSGTNGFLIAAAPTDNVMIRGLTFEGLGTGLDGIKIQTAGKVYIQNCHIDNFTGWGINFVPNNTPAELFVTNTTIRHSGNFTNNTGGGIEMVPSPVQNANATLVNVHLQGNDHGLLVQDGAQVVMKHSESAGNSFAGLNVTASTAAASLLMDQSDSVSNGTGLVVSGVQATARLTNSSFTNNGIGVNNAGTVGSWGNNYIAGNTTDLMGTAFAPLTLH
jgi:hypothetical protein